MGGMDEEVSEVVFAGEANLRFGRLLGLIFEAVPEELKIIRNVRAMVITHQRAKFD